MRSRRRSAPASAPPRFAAPASSSASAPSATAGLPAKLQDESSAHRRTLASFQGGDKEHVRVVPPAPPRLFHAGEPAMSVTAVPLRPITKGSVAKLWIGLLLLALAAAAFAWWGTAGQQWTTTGSGLQYRVVKDGQGP